MNNIENKNVYMIDQNFEKEVFILQFLLIVEFIQRNFD